MLTLVLTLDQPACKETARQYLLSYASRARKLAQKNLATLVTIYGQLNPGQPVGGWTRADLTNSIMAIEYPDFAAAGHTYAEM